jgi:hypothetical protein
MNEEEFDALMKSRLFGTRDVLNWSPPPERVSLT